VYIVKRVLKKEEGIQPYFASGYFMVPTGQVCYSAFILRHLTHIPEVVARNHFFLILLTRLISWYRVYYYLARKQ